MWLLEAPEDADHERVERGAALLDAEERARLARLRFAPDKLRYLFAHALVRTTLSRYAPETAPARWRFLTNEHGRPEIAAGAGAPPLRFNLSHTAGLVACAVTFGRDVGVDVEHLSPRRFDAAAWLEVAAAHFAPREVAGLQAQPAEARRERFFAIWTLKEAYLKARGLGLALPLTRFAFDLDSVAPDTAPGTEPRVQFDPEMNDDAAAWHFARPQAGPAHALALAARRAPGETLSVRLCRAPPESL